MLQKIEISNFTLSIVTDYPLTDDTTVFMCGPVKMMEAFAKTFTANNPKAELVYEGFSFK